METEMKRAISFSVALLIAVASFGITMLTKPPISVAKSLPGVDTYALTLKADPAMGQEYDCN